MSIPALRLPCAILEAISAHADNYAGGRVSVEAALSALGEVAAEFLAQIPDQDLSNAHRHALLEGIETATASRRQALQPEGEVLRPH